MSGWDGSGNFTRVHDWTTDRDGSIKIQASRFDAENENFRAGIEAALAKNGENAATANLDLGGYRVTNAGSASVRDDLADVATVQDASTNYAAAGGTADVITVNLSPAITAYAEGMPIWFRPSADNATTTPTLNINSVGAKTVKKFNAQALAAADLKQNRPALVTYDATDDSFLLLNVAPITPGIYNVVEDTTPQLGGDLDPNSHRLFFAKGGDIASASPLVIDTDGNYFDVTGTTGFSAMTVAAGLLFMLQFDGALTMTDGASLDLGGADITTAAGDRAVFYATAADTVQMLSYFREGTSPVPMTQAQAEAGTDTVPRYVAAEQIAQAIAAQASGRFTYATTQTTTSGSSANFTSIPSGVDFIVVMFQSVSMTGSDNLLVQIGDAGGIETSGYISAARYGGADVTSSAGFILRVGSAGNAFSGSMILSRINGNNWHAQYGGMVEAAGAAAWGGGRKTVSATLDRLSVVPSGSDSFDGGAVNIMWM